MIFNRCCALTHEHKDIPKGLRYIGIDPGKFGAIAILDGNGVLLNVTNTPLLECGDFDVLKMYSILSCQMSLGYYPLIVIEDVHSMPRDGVRGAFSFGRGLGIWHSIMSIVAPPSSKEKYKKVSPQVWKRHFGLYGIKNEVERKTKARQKVIELFPYMSGEFTKQKDHDKAEAALMARWLYEKK